MRKVADYNKSIYKIVEESSSSMTLVESSVTQV